MLKKIISFLCVAAIAAGLSLSACGEEPPERHIHKYSESVTPPTCTAKGYTTYVCECGKVRTDDYTDPLGHSFNGDTCTRCGYIRHDHIYEKTVTEPTCTEGGVERGKCKICGATYTREFGEPLGHEYVNDKCIRCGKESSASKLTFELSSDGTYYICNGVSDKEVTEIEIPSEYNGKVVSAIAGYAFSGCNDLTELTIPQTVDEIGNNIVIGCDLVTVYCEAKNKSDGWDENWSFTGGLRDLDWDMQPEDVINRVFKCPVVWDCKNNDIADDGRIYTVSNGMRYALKDGNAELLRQSRKTSGKISVPQSVIYKGKAHTVTSIESYALRYRDITGVDMPDSITNIGSSAFSDCRGLTEIKLSANLKSIERQTFMSCVGLKEVVMPDKVESVGYDAFYYCTGLERITIPASVKLLDTGAFMGCNKLKSIDFLGTKEQWNAVEKKNFAFDRTGEFTVHCTDGDLEKESVYNLIFSRGADGYVCTGINPTISSIISEITIPSTYSGTPVKEIGERAFYEKREIVDIIINHGIVKIGTYAFGKCGVKSLIIPDSVTEIGNYAFYGCPNLERIYLPKGVRNLESYTFASCPNLKEIIFNGNKAEWQAIPHTEWLYMNRCTIYCSDGKIENSGR